eukprot:10603091-Karenia_brevis.AAC.1
MDVIAHDQDREKCFDFIDLPFIAELAEALGLNAPVFSTLVSMYGAFTHRFKIRNWVSDEWCQTNGGGQGCTMTVVAANILFS